MTKLTRNLIIGGSSTVVVGGGATGAALALLHKSSSDQATNNQKVDNTTLTAKTPEEIAKAQLQNENAKNGALQQPHGFHVAETEEATRIKDAQLASSISNWQKSIDLAKARLEDLKQQKNDLAKAHELRLQALELEKAKALAEALKQANELERVNSLPNGSKYVKEIAHIDNAKDIARNIVDKEHATTGLTHTQEIQEAQQRLQALKDAEKAELDRVASLREGFIKDIKNAAHQDGVALNAWSIADRNSEKTTERAQELLAAQTRLQELKDKEAQAFAELESKTHIIVPTHQEIDWKALDATLALHQAEQAKADHELALEELARLEAGIDQLVHQRNAEYQIAQANKGQDLLAQNVAKAELAARMATVAEEMSKALQSAIATHQVALDNLTKVETEIKQTVDKENAEYHKALEFNKMASENPNVNTQAPVRNELDKKATFKLDNQLELSNARFEFSRELGLERLAGEEHAKELEQQGLAALTAENMQRQAASTALTLENVRHNTLVGQVLEQREFAKELEAERLAGEEHARQLAQQGQAALTTENAQRQEEVSKLTSENQKHEAEVAKVLEHREELLERAIALDNLARLEAGINQMVNQENAEYHKALEFNKMASENPNVNTQAPVRNELDKKATFKLDNQLELSNARFEFSRELGLERLAGEEHAKELEQQGLAALTAENMQRQAASTALTLENEKHNTLVGQVLEQREFAKELEAERLAGEEHARQLAQQGQAALTTENAQRQTETSTLTSENQKHSTAVAEVLEQRQKVAFAKVAEIASKALAEAITTHQNNLENLAKVEIEVAKYVNGRNAEFQAKMASVSTDMSHALESIIATHESSLEQLARLETGINQYVAQRNAEYQIAQANKGQELQAQYAAKAELAAKMATVTEEMSKALESAIVAHNASLDNLARLEAGINQMVNQENAEYHKALEFNKMASENPNVNTQAPVRHELDRTATTDLDTKLANSIARANFAREFEAERLAGEEHARQLAQQGQAALTTENAQRQEEVSKLTSENQKHEAEVAKVLEHREELLEHAIALDNLARLEAGINQMVNQENAEYHKALEFNKMASENPNVNTQAPVRHELDRTATTDLDTKLANSIARANFAREFEAERLVGEEHARQLAQHGQAALTTENAQRQTETSTLTSENQKHNTAVAEVLEQRQKAAFAKVAEIASKALAQAIEEHKAAVAELDKIEAQIKAEVAKENEQYRLAQLHQRDTDYTRSLTELYGHSPVGTVMTGTVTNPTPALTDAQWAVKVNAEKANYANLLKQEQTMINNIQNKANTDIANIVKNHPIKLTDSQIRDLSAVIERNAKTLTQPQLAALVGPDVAKAIFTDKNVMGAKVFINTQNPTHTPQLRIIAVGPNGIVANRDIAAVGIPFARPSITASASVAEMTAAYAQLITGHDVNSLTHALATMMFNFVRNTPVASSTQSLEQAKSTIRSAVAQAFPLERWHNNDQSHFMSIVNNAKAEAERMLGFRNSDVNRLNEIFPKFQQMMI